MFSYKFNNTLFYQKYFSFVFLAVLFLSSCTEIEERTKSDDAYIIAFEINKSQNPSLSKDYTGVFHQPTQSILVSITDIVPIHSLVPNLIISEGATVKPTSGELVDFTRPVEFKVTSSSGKVNSYTVTVSVPNSEPVISKITINDAVCPFDKSSTSFFYTLPVDNQNSVTIFCTGQHIASLTIEGQNLPNGGTFSGSRFKPGNTIIVTPLNAAGAAGTPVKLVLTSLPLITISTTETIVNEPKRVCQISLIDPLSRTNKNQHYFPPHRAGIEIRGGLAQSFPKKSYAIEFWYPDIDEEVEEGTSLLGIRNDGDWILDAMYVDRARMRNRVSMDLWIDINKVPHLSHEPNAVNGSRGYFVEVFLNDTYQGLYCLSDRVDRKQLKLDKKEGFSYKASYWSLSTEFISGDATYNNSSDTWDGWELRYQSENGATLSPRVKWEPLRDFIRFTAQSSNAEFKSELETRIDLANLTDYLLVTNALGADDNTGKNSFFSIYNDANPKFFITAWDLDATWGRKWNGSKIDLRDGEFIGVTGTPRTDSRYCRPNAFFQRLMQQNPSDIKQQMKVRWQELRSDELSQSKLAARAEAYKMQLMNSGAYDRERSRWPGSAEELNGEVAFMISWMENRLRQMDEIVNKF
jgi:spore coat protein H